MMRQQTATHGLSLSPIRAAFQKRPLRPVRYGSMSWGAFILTYVQVQMKRRSVTKKDAGQGHSFRLSSHPRHDTTQHAR